MILRRIFYFFVRNAFLILFKLYNRLGVRGLENIPDGPVLVASNHASNIDPPLIGSVFPRRLSYLAKESLFQNPIFGFIISALGAVPVRREDGQKAGAAMKAMLGLLKDGESILLFPEGSRSPDGMLGRIEAGAALLSIKSGLPIQPVYIAGSNSVCPPGKTFPKPAKLSVVFARPIYPGSYDLSSLPGDKDKRTAMTRDLEESLLSLDRKSVV